MTPRRPVRYALSLFVGGIAAMALVGCGNGMQVAGPSDPHESVVSGRATPSAAAPDDPTATPSPDQSPSPTGDATAGDDPKGSDTGGGSDDKPKTSDGSHKHSDGSKGSKKSGGHRSGGSDKKPGKSSDGKSGGGSKDDPAGESTSDPTREPTGKPRAAATCALVDLSVGARIPEGSGAAGSSYVLITYTNTSGQTCAMYGYAGVSFVGKKDGTQLGRPAVREKSTSPQQVKLSDGEVQTELLRISSAGNYDPADCVPTTSDGFRIYPPSSYTSAYVKFETDACQGKSVRQLTVYPVGTKS